MQWGRGMLSGISVFLRMSLAGHEVAMGMFQRWRCWIEGMSEELRVETENWEPGGIDAVRSEPLDSFSDRRR
jgi:hypothetical protein